MKIKLLLFFAFALQEILCSTAEVLPPVMRQNQDCDVVLRLKYSTPLLQVAARLFTTAAVKT